VIQGLYSQIIGIRDARPDKGIDPEAFAMAQSLQVVKLLAGLGKGIHDDRSHSPITLHGCSRVLSGINATLATPARSLVLWFLSHSILTDIVDATDVGDDSPLRMMVMPLAIAAALIMTV